MYPKFDQKNHWYLIKCLCNTSFYFLLLAGPVLLFLMEVPWTYIFIFLCIWLIVLLISDYRLMHVLTRRMELTEKIFYCEWLVCMSDPTVEYRVLDGDSPIAEEEALGNRVLTWNYLIGFSENKMPHIFHKFCTDEKKTRFCRLINKYLKHKRYPLLITYYKKNNVIYRIDLVDGVDYSEDFIKEFYALREMI